jgi:hypothetical protein
MVKEPHIGTLKEKSLHAALKEWLVEPGDQQEVRLENYVIDICRGDQLIEIQTGSFGNIRTKLRKLLPSYPIRLIYPIPVDKWIVRLDADGSFLRKRMSPKHGRALEVFKELVYIPKQLPHPNLTVEVVLIRQEEIWRDDGQGSWRRKGWSLYDHKLVEVVENMQFSGRDGWLAWLPTTLDQPFTNKQLCKALSCHSREATRMTYSLRHAGFIEQVGKKGRQNLYQIAPANDTSATH